MGTAPSSPTRWVSSKLPHHLVASFRSTLEEAREADLLLHVVDSSDSDWEEHVEVVHQVLADLDLAERPQLMVFNKIDRLTHEEEAILRNRILTLDPTPTVFISAHQEQTLPRLGEALKARIQARLKRLKVLVSVEDGETLATLHREGDVLGSREAGSMVEVDVRLPDAQLGRLLQQGKVQRSSDTRTGS